MPLSYCCNCNKMSTNYLFNMRHLNFLGNNKVFNSNVFNCNHLCCGCSRVPSLFSICFSSRRLANIIFNDYSNLSKPIFLLKEQYEREILYLEDKKYEIAEKLRKKYFVKALMAYAVYSATQYGITNKFRLKVLEFKKLIIFTESFVNNSLVAEANEVNPKFVIFFYYLTKVVSLGLFKDESNLSRKNALRNLFFLFVFGFERLKFFNFVKGTNLLFNLPTSKRKKKRKSDKVSASRFVYYGVVPLLFYSPFKVSFFVNNNSRFGNFLVRRSRFVANYSLAKFVVQKTSLGNRNLLYGIFRKLKLVLSLLRLKTNLSLLGNPKFKPLLTYNRFCFPVYRNSYLGKQFFFVSRSRSRILRYPSGRSSFKSHFGRYFFSLVRTFYLSRKFLLRRKRKRHNFKVKSRVLFIIRSQLRPGRLFFVGNYLKLFYYYYFIRKLEGTSFHGRIFKFRVFENLHNVLFKIFKKATKRRLIHPVSDQDVSASKESSLKGGGLAINATSPAIVTGLLTEVERQSNNFIAHFVSGSGCSFHKMRGVLKLKSKNNIFFFNISFLVSQSALSLRFLRFRFLLFFLRSMVKAKILFSVNSFLFSKYVRFLFLRLDNLSKYSIGAFNQFFLVNFFYLNNFFYLFRRKFLVNFFEKAKRANSSFFGYFNLLFSLFNSKLISNVSQAFIMRGPSSNRFIKEFSKVFHSFFDRQAEFLVPSLNIKSHGKFVSEAVPKYFYSFLPPKGNVKKYRLVFLARLEAAKKRFLSMLSRFKKQKRRVKIIFHATAGMKRKTLYRNLKKKANFFFRLLKIFMPSLKLAGRFSAFFVYRKKSKKLPILLDYYKKNFYIPKSFLRKCLDQNSNLFSRLTNSYLSKGGKLTLFRPKFSVVGDMYVSFDTTSVSYIFFTKWRAFVVSNLFGSPVARLILGDSSKCVSSWLVTIKLKYLMPILSQITSSFFAVFGSAFFDYFVLTRFFLSFRVDHLFTKLSFGFISVLLEALSVSEFLFYERSALIFLFCLPAYAVSELGSRFAIGWVKTIPETRFVSKRHFSSSFLSRSFLNGGKGRSLLKLRGRIYYFALRLLGNINIRKGALLRPSFDLRGSGGFCGRHFLSFSDYYIFFKLLSTSTFESKGRLFVGSLEYFSVLNYLPNWFCYFFLKKSISVARGGSFFRPSIFGDYFAPFFGWIFFFFDIFF